MNDYEEIIHWLDMCEEEYEDIISEQGKEGSTKRVARRMLFFASGLMFGFHAQKISKKIDNLDPALPDKKIVHMRLLDLLKLCNAQKNMQGGEDAKQKGKGNKG